jgi:hypothetical protein
MTAVAAVTPTATAAISPVVSVVSEMWNTCVNCWIRIWAISVGRLRAGMDVYIANVTTVHCEIYIYITLSLPQYAQAIQLISSHSIQTFSQQDTGQYDENRITIG